MRPLGGIIFGHIGDKRNATKRTDAPAMTVGRDVKVLLEMVRAFSMVVVSFSPIAISRVLP
jgi:hypothetical protein